MSAFDHFAAAIRAYAHQEMGEALAHARKAEAAEPESQLYRSSARYLARVVEQGPQPLYGEADAFSAFVSSGSNLPLYDHARRLLRERLVALAPHSVLDIGTGEGAVILPVALALDEAPHLTFCEPSLYLLDRAMNYAMDQGLEPEAYPLPVEDMLEVAGGEWDVAVATWSLHNLPPEQRAPVFDELCGRVSHLLIAEFDDPSTLYEEPLDERRIRHIHDRYVEGLQDYPGPEGQRVRQGFLLPALFGYFNLTGRRSTYEQPIGHWEKELEAVDFAIRERVQIYPYWWADAYLIVADSLR